jgi:hypothetical protein
MREMKGEGEARALFHRWLPTREAGPASAAAAISSQELLADARARSSMAGTPSSSNNARLRACLGHLDTRGERQQPPPPGGIQRRARASGADSGGHRGPASVTPCAASSVLGGVVCGCAGGLLGFGLAYWQQKRALGSGSEIVPPPPPSPALASLPSIPDSDEDDWRYLQLAFDAKEARRPPDHSGFRVTAVIVYTDEEGRRRHVIGHNAEVAQPALTGKMKNASFEPFLY